MTPKSKAMQSKAQGDENQVAYSELLCLHIFLGYWMKSFWAPAVPEAFQWGRKSNPEEDRGSLYLSSTYEPARAIPFLLPLPVLSFIHSNAPRESRVEN